MGAQPVRQGRGVDDAVARPGRRRRGRGRAVAGAAPGRRVRDARHDAARPGGQGRRPRLLPVASPRPSFASCSPARRTWRCSPTCARSTSTTPSWPTVTTTGSSPWYSPTGCRSSTPPPARSVRYQACLVNLEGQLDELPPPSPPEPDFTFELAQDWSFLATVTKDPDVYVSGGAAYDVSVLGNVLRDVGAPRAAAPTTLGGSHKADQRRRARRDLGAEIRDRRRGHGRRTPRRRPPPRSRRRRPTRTRKPSSGTR